MPVARIPAEIKKTQGFTKNHRPIGFWPEKPSWRSEFRLSLFVAICLLGIGLASCFKYPASKNIRNTDGKIQDGKIIGFDAQKCSCCGGWIIKVGKDTIKAGSLPNPDIKPDFTGNVKISLGSRSRRCTVNYNYYEIEKIQKK